MARSSRIKKDIPHLLTKRLWARRVSLCSYVLFILVYSVHFFMRYAVSEWPSWLLLAGVLTPLFLLSVGLVRGSPQNQILLCSALLFYFCFSLLRVLDVLGAAVFTVSSGMAVLELVMLAVLFVSALLYARWQGRAQSHG